CRLAHRRYWKIRGREIGLPSLPLSLNQIALGASNWALMALTVYILLGQRVDYPSVLGALLLGSIAGVITHIPAGLGVLEAVFIALLHHQISKGSLLAALIGYRVIYFLAPLLIAILTYLALEAKAKKLQKKNRGQSV
ncbi:MAG: lysylphosphatidylglycerol synthase domain-containing protein, partial [Gammaproteobacteria bacterium]